MPRSETVSKNASCGSRKPSWLPDRMPGKSTTYIEYVYNQHISNSVGYVFDVTTSTRNATSQKLFISVFVFVVTVYFVYQHNDNIIIINVFFPKAYILLLL